MQQGRGPRGQLKRTGKLKYLGKRGQRQNRFYEQERTLHLKKYPFCALCLREGIRNRDVMVHHRAGRDGSLLWHRPLFLSTCFEHHVYIHDNIKESVENGWIVRLSKGEEDAINEEYRKMGMF